MKQLEDLNTAAIYILGAAKSDDIDLFLGSLMDVASAHGYSMVLKKDE